MEKKMTLIEMIREKTRFNNASVKPFVYVDAKILPGKLAVYVEDLPPGSGPVLPTQS